MLIQILGWRVSRPLRMKVQPWDPMYILWHWIHTSQCYMILQNKRYFTYRFLPGAKGAQAPPSMWILSQSLLIYKFLTKLQKLRANTWPRIDVLAQIVNNLSSITPSSQFMWRCLTWHRDDERKEEFWNLCSKTSLRYLCAINQFSKGKLRIFKLNCF